MEKGNIGNPLDVAGIGFGPSNLALAVCASEQEDSLTCLFFEQKPRFQWHPGMLIDGARMQISFLKDLVSLRNLSSPYTFLRYLDARGRLEQFVNLGTSRPTRLEFEDYLRWVADDFADQVQYGTDVVSVVPVSSMPGGPLDLFEVRARDVHTAGSTVVYSRNVVYAAGGRPNLPATGHGDGARIIHSSEFLQRFPALFPDHAREATFVVIGAGQSAGEIADYLLSIYDSATVHLVISKYALRPTDNSQFVNEQFFSHRVDEFFELGQKQRLAIGDELQNANYGVIREELIERLYDVAYQDVVKGRERLVVHTYSRLSDVSDAADGTGQLVVTVDDRFGGKATSIRCDSVLMATGYDRSLRHDLFAELLPHMSLEGDRPVLSRACRARTTDAIGGGLYFQGTGEAQLGLGDTLLSMLPFRAKDIVTDIQARRALTRRSRSEYPPGRYVETDEEKLYALIERFRFATVIATGLDGRPLATHVPLVLHRDRGRRGTLAGHLDRANPQIGSLEGGELLVVFHGPNAYMPPTLYSGNPLPTWNSMVVHVRGRATLVRDRDAVVQGLCDLAARLDDETVLSPDDPRIEKLIDHVVGFEIRIDDLVGRFKLSQERDEPNRRNAAAALAHRAEAGERDFIEYMVGLSLRGDGPRH